MSLFAVLLLAAHLSTQVQAITALENEWLAHEHDRAVLENILAPDFLHPVFTGDVLDRKQHIDWAVTHGPPPDFKSRFERLDVRIFGDVGIATGIVAATVDGKDAGRTLFTDIFCLRNGRWQAVQAQETPIRSLPPPSGASPRAAGRSSH